jgi:hypothetical protein
VVPVDHGVPRSSATRASTCVVVASICLRGEASRAGQRSQARRRRRLIFQ